MEPVTESAPHRQPQPPPPQQQPQPQPQLLLSPPPYGYHNTHHTHAQPLVASPPSYARAQDPKVLQWLDQRTRHEALVVRANPLPPPYTCSVAMQGIVGVKQELISPFHVSRRREWCDVYAMLTGTQLRLYRVKVPSLFSRNTTPGPGKLLRTYSLQHAEAGVASDFRKTPLVPRSPFALMVPSSSRRKLYETDPDMFEPVREHAIRLRLELEQFLLCLPSESLMLDWIEALTAAIDISPPLEDRSEPRYRSLPRRNRRQRLLDNVRLGDHLDQLSDLEAGRRLIEQQDQIMRALYPHLAATSQEATPTHANPAAAAAAAIATTTTTITATTTTTITANNTSTTDHEADEFDPEDARFPTTFTPHALQDDEQQQPITDEQPSDPKLASRSTVSPSHEQRYRRRCAPVLLASSPRVSDVIFCEGIRVRINVRDATLYEYTAQPPRYDAHKFPKPKSKSKAKRSPPVATGIPTPTTAAPAPAPASTPTRPSSSVRAVSNNNSVSSLSFGEELGPATSASNADDMEIEVDPGVSRPSSLAEAAMAQGKPDAGHPLEKTLGSKVRVSEHATITAAATTTTTTTTTNATTTDSRLAFDVGFV